VAKNVLLPRTGLPADLAMASYKPKDEIAKSKPTGFDSGSNSSNKNTKAGIRRELKEIGAIPSDTTVGVSDASKRMELTRIATELHDIDFGDPVLDPTSPNFDVYKWAKTVMRAADKAGVKFRRASFAFKNLVVSGSGSTVRFQANVASVFMAPFRVHEYVNFGKKPEKAILNSFDGVIKPGEMLLVLGRPGSGCSTFLKAVSGELHGLKVDKDSKLDYNGLLS
jgi:ATP-binding cassette subfamily G (WHITE) protein 2 (PDR)